MYKVRDTQETNHERHIGDKPFSLEACDWRHACCSECDERKNTSHGRWATLLFPVACQRPPCEAESAPSEHALQCSLSLSLSVEHRNHHTHQWYIWKIALFCTSTLIFFTCVCVEYVYLIMCISDSSAECRQDRHILQYPVSRFAAHKHHTAHHRCCTPHQTAPHRGGGEWWWYNNSLKSIHI